MSLVQGQQQAAAPCAALHVVEIADVQGSNVIDGGQSKVGESAPFGDIRAVCPLTEII